MNRSNNNVRTAILTTNEIGMNDHHQMQGQHQQHYSQPSVYADDNDLEQREGLLRSLEQNPHMLRDFYQFIEFTRARSAQPFVQQIGFGQNMQNQQPIPSILNMETNIQHNSSTPKRGRPLNDSGESISSAPKQHKSSKSTRIQMEHAAVINQQQRKSLPFDQLKRAISSNIPSFFIEFDQSITAQRLPSAFEAGNVIEKHFKEQKVNIEHFSLVGWSSNRLKLGVNNKDDYMVLLATNKWPTHVNNIPIRITKPKYIPDCFALVVRYVPSDMEPELVKEEIKRTIASADNIKQIHYSYERKFNDFKFTVTNLNEYNTALKLGRIAICNRWVTISSFLAGYRMTFCTKCWKIGHIREQCKTSLQRCRVCLDGIEKKEEHNCIKRQKCAQCGGEHHSLHGTCRVIQQYRSDLKEDVNKALESGKLHRIEYTKQQHAFSLKDQDFPPLEVSKKPRQSTWNHVQTDGCTDESLGSKAILLINENLVAMRDSNRRIEEKLEKIDIKLNQTALHTEIQQTTMVKLIDQVRLLIQHTIWPVTKEVKPGLLNSASGLQCVMDKLKELKTNLCNDYEIRRKRADSPSMQNTSSSTAEDSN
ncbi:unnamed protein product, partial [Rotaria magnacalcarata]